MRMNTADTPRLPRLSIGLVSASALGYEVLLMRLFSIIQWHHFAYMIISLALLGYGASGTFISMARPWLLRRYAAAYCGNLALFGLSAVLCFLLAQRLPFNAEEVLWDWRQPLYLAQLYLLLTVPFFFAANAIALALSRHTTAIARLYAADLLGAGLGSLLIIGLLFMLAPQLALQGIGIIGLLAALVATRELRLSPRWQLLAVAGITALLLLPANLLELRVSPYKSLPQILRITGTSVIAEHTSPLGLLSVVRSDAVPLRHAPGLSLYADSPIPEQLGVFTDADGMTAIDHNPEQAPLDYLDQLTSALPYHLAEPRRVLVLGAGGGSDIQQALNHGVARVDAVELDPELAELVSRDYATWSGNIYTRAGVQVQLGDAMPGPVRVDDVDPYLRVERHDRQLAQHADGAEHVELSRLPETRVADDTARPEVHARNVRQQLANHVLAELFRARISVEVAPVPVERLVFHDDRMRAHAGNADGRDQAEAPQRVVLLNGARELDHRQRAAQVVVHAGALRPEVEGRGGVEYRLRV